MNTINNNIQDALINSLYNNTITAPEQNKIKKQEQNSNTINASEDLVQLSNQNNGTNLLSKSLDVLVQNETITQDQKTAIEDAFNSNTNSLGTYTRKPTDPLSNLVKNGTITKDQVTSIKSALKTQQKQQAAIKEALTLKAQAFNSGSDDNEWL